MDHTTQVIFLVFTIAIAVAVLLQTAILAGLAIGAYRTRKKMLALAEELRSHALPVIASSRKLVEDVSPKLRVISKNLAETATTVRARAESIGQTVGDVVDRTRTQTARVDQMVTGTLDQVSNATSAVHQGMSGSIRHINGVFSGIRAGIDVLLSREPSRNGRGEDPLA